MRVGLVRKIGFTLVALGVVGLSGCNDDPLDFDEQTAVRMFTNPSFMVVQTGDSVQLVANGINGGNEPTFQAVTATVASCGGSGSISVVESDQQTSIQPPQIYEVIGGTALGGACVVVQSGSVTDTVDVVVVGGTLNVTSAPTLIIAGTGGTVVVELVGTDGTPVTPFDPTDVAWTSDNTAVLSVDATGVFTSPGPSGSATITATWTGTDATGTSGQGVSLVATASVTVKPDVPIAAAFAAGFPALAAGGVAPVVVFVADQFGNQVVDSLQVLGISVMSDDVAVATAADNFAPDALGSLAITATGVGAGVANFSGIVTTSGTSADLAYGPAAVSVLDPIIASIPSSGPAVNTAIAGSGFMAAGFTTSVFSDGMLLNDITVDSDVQITARMPTLAPGDHEITVDVGGITSAPMTWTSAGVYDEDEPNNDAIGTAPALSFPFDFDGVADVGEVVQGPFGGHYDLYAVTLVVDGTIDITLTWDNVPADLDVYIWESSFGPPDGGFGTLIDGVPGPPDGWSCVVAGGSGGGGFQPEATGSCALPAGDYLIWIYDFGAGTSNYNVEGTFTSP